MKKIYITDLDHTFLQNDLSISDYTKKTWNAYALHSIMGIATARTYKKSREFLKDIAINAPMVLLDGALVVTQDKKIIDTKFISKERGDMIIEEGAKLGIYPFIIALADKNLNEAFLYSSVLNKHQIEVLSRYEQDSNLEKIENLKAMEHNFKLVYMGEKIILEELLEHLKDIFGDTIKYIFAPEVYIGCYFLTILHKDADKAHGIESVREYLDFDLNKLTVFGDNHNDLGMFALANTSVAVANAQEAVKKEATHVLSHTNDEDGVAKYLASLVDG